jgi:hypothetical protein
MPVLRGLRLSVFCRDSEQDGLSGADNSSAKAPKPANFLQYSRKVVDNSGMTRRKVFVLRLAATAGLLLLALAVVGLLWFPGGYFAVSGVGKRLLVLAAVALVIGPGLSAFVYIPGKKGLTGDLWLLAGLEVGIVAVVMSMLYTERTFYAVFAVDRFEAVSRDEIDLAQITDATFHKRPGHEPRLVYAEIPKDPETVSKLIDETMFEGKKDIDRRPEFWKPYSAGVAIVRAAGKPLEQLLGDDSTRAVRVQRWISRHDARPGEFLYLPLRGRGGDAIIILHARNAYPVDVLGVDPW